MSPFRIRWRSTLLNMNRWNVFRGRVRSTIRQSRSRREVASEACEQRILLAAFSEFVDPHPEVGNGFGDIIVPLRTGNVVIVAPWDDAGGVDAGAVYLFNGSTGKLISKLTGSGPGDQIGSHGVVALSGGNFVVISPLWDNGSATDSGAVTWGHGKRGVSGVVSSRNSLIGSHSNDRIGIGDSDSPGVTLLENGNYVVRSPLWDNGAAIDAGAATWGRGNRGIKGLVSPENSLVGSHSHDSVGSNGITALTNGNYVVNSPDWANGAATGAGAVTWCNGKKGGKGEVSVSNSLVGSQSNDHVGYKNVEPTDRQNNHNGVTALANGHFVVSSPLWSNGSVISVGAATWGDGKVGITGVVSPSNSLIGSQPNDRVGERGAMALSNGHYVVSSPWWANGFFRDAGAATWGNGESGITGVVSSANSLVGDSNNDMVGDKGVTALSNGNYVVISWLWDSETGDNAGAVTWGNGQTGIRGPVSISNSLVGGRSGDGIGSDGVTALRNGNYVVVSTGWSTVSAPGAGAVTWGNGLTGTAGVVNSSNSLVGSHFGDMVGSMGVVALTNGNYVVSSQSWYEGPEVPWEQGDLMEMGAVTWGNGQTGISGVVSSANSLVGSTGIDLVGFRGVTALSNGNYVVNSSLWGGESLVRGGAVTWGNGETGVAGTINLSNSLIGDSFFYDQVGDGGIIALPSGDYVVSSPHWGLAHSNGVGAVTWGNGQTGTSGAVNSSNSLLGTDPSSGHLLRVTVDAFNKTVLVRFVDQGIGRVFVRPQ